MVDGGPHIRLLGRIVVEGSDDLALGPPKQRALLAALALAPGTVVSGADLIAALWDEPPPSAHAVLQTYVSGLRRMLEPSRKPGEPWQVLLTRRPGYLLDIAAANVDAERFSLGVEAGRTALRRDRHEDAAAILGKTLLEWQGEPLADAGDAPVARQARHRLEALRIDALELRISADLGRGRHAELVPELQRLVADEPFREGLRASLIVALYRCGRQAEALRIYEDGRVLLADELGADPSPELQRVHTQVLRHDAALQPPAAALPRADEATGHPPAAAQPQLDSAAGAPARVVESAVQPANRRRPRRTWRAVAIVSAIVLFAGLFAGLNSRRSPAQADILTPGAVGLVDLEQHSVGGQALLGERPSALVADRGRLWAALPVKGVLASVDAAAPATVREVTLEPGLAGAAAADGAVWVTQPDQRSLIRVDQDSGRVAQRIGVGGRPGPVAATPGAVWVANRLDDTVMRVDARTGRVMTTVGVGRDPVALSAAADAVWVISAGDATLTRISIRGSTSQRFRLTGSPTDVIAAHGAVWVSDAVAGTVSRIDPVTGIVRSSVAVGTGAAELAATGKAVIVGSAYDGWLMELAPRTGAAGRRLHLGASPLAVHSDGKRLWAGSAAAVAAGRRGGMLRVAVPAPMESPDPAAAFSSNGWAVTSLTHAGLTTVRRAGGADGTVVVPDLAVSLPVPTDGGRTWTFRLRSGVEYSTGGTVQPGDVRPSFERLLRDGVPYYGAIVGAERCGRRACNLSQGIVGDARERTVTFRLSRPDPDFLARLALPIAAILPADTPPVVPPESAAGFDWSHLATTGPYRVHEVIRTTVVLVRNERFTSWSRTAAPDGLADRIEVRYEVDPQAAVRDALAGRVDVALDPPPGQLAELATRFPTRVQRFDEPGVYRLVLDTRHQPFASALARRAVAVAVDRTAAAAALAPDLLAVPGCQVLPPVVPGYQPYCPFGVGGSDRARRPDIAAARALVAQSGTAGAQVRLFAPPPRRAAAEVVARAMRQIGYDVRLSIVEVDYFRLVADTRTTPEAHLAGWYAESPSAASFALLVRCSAHVPRADNNTNLNVAGYCDQTAERLIETALHIQQDDPASSSAAWREVDHHLTDTVAWVPLASVQRAVVRSEGATPVVYIPLLGPALELTAPAPR